LVSVVAAFVEAVEREAEEEAPAAVRVVVAGAPSAAEGGRGEE